MDHPDFAKLYKLADYLDTVPSTRFDMASWGYEKNPGWFSRTFRGAECGFAGCAMGWAAHSGLFENLTMSGSHEYDICTPVLWMGESAYYQGFEAAEVLFNIEPHVAHRFFSAFCYQNPTPRDVADRIRNYSSNYIRNHNIEFPQPVIELSPVRELETV